MITRHPATSRGRTQIGWLDSWHTFSFGDFHDAAMMGFRALRVMNDDIVAPAQGFGMHGHRDMEIVTYMLEGSLAHKDSMGNSEALNPGELQAMTAGRGIQHSEFNPSKTQRAHLYQIWLLPRAKGLKPAYAQKPFAAEGRADRWQHVASGTGADGALAINTDAEIMLATLGDGREVSHTLAPNRHAWVQVLRGSASVNGVDLAEGDGASISDEAALTVRSDSGGEVMLFDLA